MNIYDVIKKPLITEKTTTEKDARNIVAFVVHRDANKIEIKYAVQKLWNVTVLKVRTAIVRGKQKRVGRYMGRCSNWKRALVTLAPGQKIEFFEGV